MIEFLPYLLILVGWDVSAPAESMVIASSLHPTEEVCVEKGEAFVAKRGTFESPYGTAKYRYFCIPAPTPDEYHGAFEQMK